jgi:hypothetical protein
MDIAWQSVVVQNRILIPSLLSVKIWRLVLCLHRGQTVPVPEPTPLGKPSHPIALHLGFVHWYVDLVFLNFGWPHAGQVFPFAI